MTAILGVSAFYHDSAAALVIDGRIVAAAQEERFTRRKHDERFPFHAIDYCLREGGLEPGGLHYVGLYDKPLLKFERLLETYLAYAPAGFPSFVRAMPVWLKEKLYLPREMNRGLRRAFRKRYVFTEHHESHAASAFFPSPFEEAAILTLDGVGEWATATFGVGQGNRISLTHEMRFPHSLGLLYSAFTYFTGFEVNSGEYKLMGLAPYGEPRYANLILERLIDLKQDGSFRMDMSYFNYCEGLTMTSSKFDALFGGPPRNPTAPVTEREMDMAASIQEVTNEIMLRSARHIRRTTGMRNLCLAGGVALNCVGNGHILRSGIFDDVWIQPAAGDAGGALGVALFIWHQLLGQPRTPSPRDSQAGSWLGPAYTTEDIRTFLRSVAAPYRLYENDAELCNGIAAELADGKVVGWFQDRMEFGPRALGSRSILGDARSPAMQTVMNMKVKFREGFRPFAPAVLREHAAEYFGDHADRDSPYMLLVFPVREDKRQKHEAAPLRGIDRLKELRSVIPAVTHVDYSARVQTVDADRHGLFHSLMQAFYERTGCPVIVNTSFNLGWDPIVCTPEDAFKTFMSSDIDVLCLGRFVLRKSEQPACLTIASRTGTHYVADPICSPCCQSRLEASGSSQVRCCGCNRCFAVEAGIPLLFMAHDTADKNADVTEKVKAFYEETPFPNYDEHETVRSLIDKSRRGRYAKKLNEAIPFNSTVLEVGCGTGQLSNFLGISCRRVIGADLCVNSLKLAEGFRARHGLDRVRFVQMNLFRPCLRPGQFDVVLCNGVLHHTSDPEGGFWSLVPLVRPGGYLVVGLYNKYGRLMTNVRRMLFRITGNRGSWIDPYLRTIRPGADRRRAWFADQYLHPHESKHTTDEVLRWFEACGLEFVRGVPSIVDGHDGLADEMLFTPTRVGSRLEHFAAQLRQVATGNREGGFFLMIGRRPSAATAVVERPASTYEVVQR